VVVEAIKSNPQGRSELCSIITSIKALLQCNSSFEIKFTKHQTNMAAHSLTKEVISWSRRIYFNCISPCIDLIIIINEMS
jgi:hypothetical protein